MDKAFLEARLAATKVTIVKYEEAIDALVDGGHESYRLDTGQGVQRVTRLNIEFMQKQLEGLYNRCATMEARLKRSGVTRGRPDW